ncbi:MAG: glycosyltransferase family 4 protein [Ignavibacteriales bacterium]|nr:glycosyltransferase family 4 protein [Ignavibacteriales bacterium]
MTLLIGHGFRQIFRILVSMPSNDIVFCWFASVYASVALFAARFFGKKTVVVVGGVDVAKEPQLNYGIFLSWWRAPLIRYVLRNADRVLVVDESLRPQVVMRSGYGGKNIEYLPTGSDPAFWKSKGTKRNEILCVAVVLNKKRVQLKGIDTLIEAAKKIPKTKFTLIGVQPEAVSHLNLPDNVRLIEPMLRSDLLKYYQKAKVYCQPSRREGLPNTLCEAMLCECIPVVTDVGGNGNAVGDTGLVVARDDLDALAAALRQALKTSAEKGKRARKRILEEFPQSRRERMLLNILSELTV